MHLLPTLKDFYKKHKRSFLWRRTRDPYKILVSEVMLQQTQAKRVVPFYNKFIKRFPSPSSLAEAKLSEVLALWQGLGYNRRAKYLHGIAKVLVRGSRAPHLSRRQEAFAEHTPEYWEELPGVGPYTARAVVAFAYNKPTVFIETNIRTVYTHFYFPKRRKVSDSELLPLIERDLKKSKMQPRDFYAALMDYGSYLKASGVRINRKSKHYIKQSTFEGSARQLRGAILRELLNKPQTLAQLAKNLSRQFDKTEGEVQKEADRLVQEKFVAKEGAKFTIG